QPGRDPLEQRLLHARRIIFGRVADRVEQLRAAFVVEILGGSVFGWRERPRLTSRASASWKSSCVSTSTCRRSPTSLAMGPSYKLMAELAKLKRAPAAAASRKISRDRAPCSGSSPRAGPPRARVSQPLRRSRRLAATL